MWRAAPAPYPLPACTFERPDTRSCLCRSSSPFPLYRRRSWLQGRQFDVILDSAVYHVFRGSKDRQDYVHTLGQLVKPGGFFLGMGILRALWAG